jgi:hypothetical protein
VTTTFSNNKGIAPLIFTVPASQDYFGIWNVTASADIAGEVVSDYVFFRVGWLVFVKEIAIEPIEEEWGYQKLIKGGTYKISSTLRVITMQPPNKCVQLNGLDAKTLIVYTGFDELNQALFTQYSSANIEYFMKNTPNTSAMIEFVLRNQSRPFSSAATSITIPFSAFSGVAKISGNVFTDFPWYKGVPYSVSTVKEVWLAAPRELPSIPTPTIPTTMGVLSVKDAITRVGSTFTVTITVQDIDPAAHIVGFQFRLKFEKSLLTPIEAVEGTFVKQFGDTYFICYIEEDVLVGILQLPPWPGAAGWMSGSGNLVQIKFQAINAGNCILTLTSAYMVDANGNEVKFDRLEYGVCRIVA